MSAESQVVVVGSGPSGAMAAEQLVKAGVSVTMLESGSRPPNGIIVRAAGRTLFRWRSMQALSSDRHISTGDPLTEFWSSLSPGGLSNYWTAAVPRFAPEDFTDGARIDERFRWPITYDELIPFYEAAEAHLSITGPATPIPRLPLGLTQHQLAAPSDWNALRRGALGDELTVLPLARGSRWMVVGRGSEFNSYHIIARPLQRHSGFELLLGAHVTRLIQSRFGAVEGVEYLDTASRALRTIRAQAVVLAAGTVDTTRILLSSVSAASPVGLGNEHGLVGRYVHDHPRDWWPVEFERPLTLLDHPLYLARAAYGTSPSLSGASATIGLAATRDLAKTWIGQKGRRFGVQVFGTMTPSEDHVIRLSANRVDRLGLPCVEINVRYDDAARTTLSDMRDRFARVFADAGAPVRVESVNWMPRPGSSVHYAGSVRMHTKPDLGVLDGWNRVHTCPNVVVVDMSCFTTNPEKNPTLTAMALSARAARRLAHDLKACGGATSRP